MRTAMKKQEIINTLHRERVLFDELVAAVGPERMKIPGAMGRWTFHDLIAHLTAWWQREVGCAESIRRGETPMPHPSQPEVQLINDWIYNAQRYRSLEQLLRDLDEVWQRFEAVIQSMPEHELVAVGQYEGYDKEPLGSRMLSDFIDHYHNDHEADVVAWLTSFEVTA